MASFAWKHFLKALVYGKFLALQVRKFKKKCNHINFLLLLYIKPFPGIILNYFFKPGLEMREESISPVDKKK